MAAPRPQHHSLLPHWLIHLGTLGLFAVAVLDSSVIPLPLPGSTDLLLLWLVSHRGEPWLLTAVAIAGSLLGGYITWSAGHQGGERALATYEKRPLLKRVSAWVKQHSLAAVLIPAALPPPIPLTPFLLAAGALGVPRNRFLAAFGIGRSLRYGLVTWLAIRYGRHVVGLWNRTLSHCSTLILCILIALTVAGVAAGIWQMRRRTKRQWEEESINASPDTVPHAT